MAGASPLDSRIATARSRSQLEPGKTMTALFMGLCPSGGALDPEILDHDVGEELPAHRLDIVVADAFGQVELDQLSGAHVVDSGETEAFQRVVDRLALRVEDAVLQRDIDAGDRKSTRLNSLH